MKHLKNILTYSFAVGLILVVMSGCKKQDVITVPPSEAHFTNLSGSTFFVTAPGATFKIPVGLTNPSNESKIVTFSVTSPTGAVAGTQYTISGGNTLTIPAGKAIDSITVNAVYAQYTGARKDTLIFTITDEPSVKASSYNKVYRLFVRGACLEDDIKFADLLGTYTKTFEDGSYGPYTSTLINYTAISATSGKATLTNIYESGISAVVTFDWSVPGNFTATVPLQASTASYPIGGSPSIQIRSTPGAASTFNYCSQRFTLPLQLFTSGGAGVAQWVTTLAR